MNEQTLHRFPVDVAEDVGVNAAIIFFDICYWCHHNEASGKNFYDGYNWMFSKIDDFVERHQYFTRQSVRTALDKLTRNGWVVKEKSLNGGFSNVCYYRPVDMFWVDMLKTTHGNVENNTPIKYNINNITTITKGREDFIKEFRSSKINRENAMMITGITSEEELEMMCGGIFAEWELSGTTDWSWRHLINHLRIAKRNKDADNRRNNGQAKSRTDRNEEFAAHILSKIASTKGA